MARAQSIEIRRSLNALPPASGIERPAAEKELIRRRRLEPRAVLWTSVLGFATDRIGESYLAKLAERQNRCRTRRSPAARRCTIRATR